MTRKRVQILDFTFQPDTSTLHRKGQTIRLPIQAGRVLSHLAARPGEVVSRQDLSKVVWLDGTNTDFSQGLNNIISRLRNSFQDDPTNPKYIETVQRLGYRLVAPVVICEEQQPPPYRWLNAAKFGPERASGGEGVPSSAPKWHRLHFFTRVAAGVSVIAAIFLIAGGAYWHHAFSNQKGSEISLAIAPFDIADSDSKDDSILDGFSTDLIQRVSELPGLAVKAKHSIHIGPGKKTIPLEEARQLNTDDILYSRVHREQGVYVFSLELVRASDSRFLASWHYEGTKYQFGQIVRQVQDDLFNFLQGSRRSQGIRVGGTSSTEAYSVYLSARSHSHQRLPETLEAAVGEYQKALSIDPNFADGYSGLAETYLALGAYTNIDRSESYKQAEALCRKSIQLAPGLASAHAQLGLILFRRDWQFDAGIAEVRKALAVDSTNAVYHVWLATMLTQLRRFDYATLEIDEAKRDDPFWPAVYGDEAYLEAAEHQYKKLEQTITTLAHLQPNWSGTLDMLAWSQWITGNYVDAVETWLRMALMDKDVDRYSFESNGLKVLRERGPRAYAKLRLQASLDQKPHQHVPADFQIGEWYAYSGEREAALKQLKTLADQHSMDCLEFAIDGAYASFHKDPEFIRTLDSIGLPSKF